MCPSWHFGGLIWDVHIPSHSVGFYTPVPRAQALLIARTSDQRGGETVNHRRAESLIVLRRRKERREATHRDLARRPQIERSRKEGATLERREFKDPAMEVASPLAFMPIGGSKRSLSCSPTARIESPPGGRDLSDMEIADDGLRAAKRRRFHLDTSVDSLSEVFSSHSPFFSAGIHNNNNNNKSSIFSKAGGK